MTRRIFNFNPPDRFICGAIGEPGRRTFFLQARQGSRVVSVVLEKVQVAVLAERLATLLLALRESGVAVGESGVAVSETGPPAGEAGPLAGAEGPPPALAEPVREEFRVGTLTIAWDAAAERIVIEAREMSEQDDLDETADEAGDADAVDGPDLVRVHLPAADAHAFAVGAVAVVQAGRPPCPLCGAPLDPTGHFCPRRNGLTH